jgi:hypothetical protein
LQQINPPADVAKFDELRDYPRSKYNDLTTKKVDLTFAPGRMSSKELMAGSIAQAQVHHRKELVHDRHAIGNAGPGRICRRGAKQVITHPYLEAQFFEG